jgi:hypothetical protein
MNNRQVLVEHQSVLYTIEEIAAEMAATLAQTISVKDILRFCQVIFLNVEEAAILFQKFWSDLADRLIEQKIAALNNHSRRHIPQSSRPREVRLKQAIESILREERAKRSWRRATGASIAIKESDQAGFNSRG